MISQVVFKIDSQTKALAMKRAKSEGVPFASILKLATKAFAEGKFSVDVVEREEEVLPHKLKQWYRQSKLMDEGKGIHFKSMKECREYMRNL